MMNITKPKPVSIIGIERTAPTPASSIVYKNRYAIRQMIPSPKNSFPYIFLSPFKLYLIHIECRYNRQPSTVTQSKETVVKAPQTCLELQ